MLMNVAINSESGEQYATQQQVDGVVLPEIPNEYEWVQAEYEFGQVWNPQTREYEEAPGDPAYAGQSAFYLFVTPDGERVPGGGFDPSQAPPGTEAVRVDHLPGPDEEWSATERRYVPRVGLQAVIESRLFEPVKQRAEAITWLSGYVETLGLPDEQVQAAKALLAMRLSALNVEIANMVGAYLLAAQGQP